MGRFNCDSRTTGNVSRCCQTLCFSLIYSFFSLIVCFDSAWVEAQTLPPLSPSTGMGTNAVSPHTGQGHDPLGIYEQQIYAQSYGQEALESRLIRLETLLFGEPQVGAIEQRQFRLLQVLQNQMPGAPSHPQKGTESGQQQIPLPDANTSESQTPGFYQPVPPKQPPTSVSKQPKDATDYPTVTNLERKIFGQDFRQEDIQERLNRLEGRMFGLTYPNLPLVDRVDNLLTRVPIATPNSKSAIQKLPDLGGQFTGPSGSDLYLKLDLLEKVFLNGQSLSGSLITERLDQLEKNLFGSTFGSESVDTRMNRLMTAFESRYGKTSPSFSLTKPGTTATTSPKPNIRIGGTFSGSSQYQYSQELLDMLPNDVRSQMQSNPSQGSVRGNSGFSTRSSSQSLTTTAPGTVVIEETREYPGFFNYGKTTTFRNLYTFPGGGSTALDNPYGPSTQTQMAPSWQSSSPMNSPVLPYAQPGSVTTYMTPSPYPNTGLNYGYGVGLLNDPQTLQMLGNLEQQVFGQPNYYAPPAIRLSQLEAAILGQSFVGVPDLDRLNNLQRAYQLQSVGKTLGKGKLGKIGRTAGSLLFGVPMPGPNGTTPSLGGQ